MTTPPIIFLLGPPGAGKTTLGSRACKELGLEFLDLAGLEVERLSRVVGDIAADVVEVPVGAPARAEGAGPGAQDWRITRRGRAPRRSRRGSHGLYRRDPRGQNMRPQPNAGGLPAGWTTGGNSMVRVPA
jgi:hypothetical protein